jgi:hypothetical protein
MEDFVPHNELEKRLLALIAGDMPADAFMLALATDQVFMPVEDEKSAIKGFQRSTRAKPLVVADDAGVPVLLVFTSPDRAKPVVEEFPDYNGGLLAEFTWILERVDDGSGIAINPGWEVGFDMTPEDVTQLKHMLSRTGHA